VTCSVLAISSYKNLDANEGINDLACSNPNRNEGMYDLACFIFD
jgi:hypothetical protein